MLGRDRVQQPQLPQRGVLVPRLAGQARQPQQAERGGRAAGRDRRVLELLAAGDQRLVVGRGGEEAAALGVGEAVEDLVGERARLGEPARVEGRLVEREQRLEQERVVLEVGVEVGAALVVRAQEPPAVVAQVAQHELGGSDRGVAVVRLAEHGAGVGQRGDHQRVPRRQPLVVEPGSHAALAGGQEAGLDLGEPVGVGGGADRDVGALEVARLGHAEVLDRGVGQGPERLAHLGRRPHVELALDALGVGVERAREPALRLAELAQRPVERLARDALEEGARPRPGRRAGTRARAARCRTASSRSGGRSSGRRPSSARSRRRPGRTCRRPPSGAGCGAPSGARRAGAGTRSSTPPGTSARRPSRRSRRRSRAAAPAPPGRARGVELGVGRLDPRGRLQVGDDPVRPVDDLVALLVPRARDAVEHHPPARHAVARLGREVGAGVNGRPSGVRKAFSGQPPWPVIACTASM